MHSFVQADVKRHPISFALVQ